MKFYLRVVSKLVMYSTPSMTVRISAAQGITCSLPAGVAGKHDRVSHNGEHNRSSELSWKELSSEFIEFGIRV